MKNSQHSRLAHASLALLAAATLAMPALARGPARGQKGPGGDPELQNARQQLVAATVVAKLQLSREQKVALKKILGQARELRDENRNSAEVKQHRARAKALLNQATLEARANQGEMSTDTRAQLEALRAERAPERGEHRATMQALMQGARNVLTPEQQQKLQQVKGPRGPGAREGRQGPGRRGGQGMKGKQRGKKMMHLLLSDAFLAELGR